MSNATQTEGFGADGATTNIAQYAAVIGPDGDNKVDPPGAAGAKALGIIQEKVTKDGESVSVTTRGLSFANAASAISVGDDVAVADIEGKIETNIATYSTDLGVAHTDVLWTAQAPDWSGLRGEDITIEYRDPGANSQSLLVVVEGTAIIVHLATDGGGAITSTADLIKAAVAALPEAAAMVVGTDIPTDDGSGIVTELAAARLVAGVNLGVARQAATAADDIIRIDVGGK